MRSDKGLLIIYMVLLTLVVMLSLVSLFLSLGTRERSMKNHELICQVARTQNVSEAILAKDC